MFVIDSKRGILSDLAKCTNLRVERRLGTTPEWQDSFRLVAQYSGGIEETLYITDNPVDCVILWNYCVKYLHKETHLVLNDTCVMFAVRDLKLYTGTHEAMQKHLDGIRADFAAHDSGTAWCGDITERLGLSALYSQGKDNNK